MVYPQQIIVKCICLCAVEEKKAWCVATVKQAVLREWSIMVDSELFILFNQYIFHKLFKTLKLFLVMNKSSWPADWCLLHSQKAESEIWRIIMEIWPRGLPLLLPSPARQSEKLFHSSLPFLSADEKLHSPGCVYDCFVVIIDTSFPLCFVKHDYNSETVEHIKLCSLQCVLALSSI